MAEKTIEIAPNGEVHLSKANARWAIGICVTMMVAAGGWCSTILNGVWAMRDDLREMKVTIGVMQIDARDFKMCRDMVLRDNQRLEELQRWRDGLTGHHRGEDVNP